MTYEPTEEDMELLAEIVRCVEENFTNPARVLLVDKTLKETKGTQFFFRLPKAGDLNRSQVEWLILQLLVLDNGNALFSYWLAMLGMINRRKYR